MINARGSNGTNHTTKMERTNVMGGDYWTNIQNRQVEFSGCG